MKDKTILITGAGSGIGRDTAIALSKRGYDVIATTHKEESVEQLKEYASKNNTSFKSSFELDISKPSDYEKIKDLKIDVLINNAAIGESGSLTEIPLERLKNNFETNVFGTLNLSQVVFKKMMLNNSGRIIFISSLFGRISRPFFGSYCMTKFSLSAAADVIRREVKMITKNIHISVIEPGAYHTGFNQKVMATKYQWMDENSYFYKLLNKIKKDEETFFNRMELKSTQSIVKKIIKAIESKNPRFRYTMPLWQSIPVQILRILGK